jgi:hypothetical protein
MSLAQRVRFAAPLGVLAVALIACGSEPSTTESTPDAAAGAGGTSSGGAGGGGASGSGGSGATGGSGGAGTGGSGAAGTGGNNTEGGTSCSGDANGLAAMRAADFIDTLGVNVHVEYTDGDYADVAGVIADLSYLGIHHVRDANLNPSNQGQASYGTVADAGYRFNLHTGGDPMLSVQRIHDFVAQHPGSVAAIEGPNEVNNWPVSYSGLTGDAAAQAFQTALYDAAKADALLRDIPVYGVTSWPEFSSKCDFGNYHSYAHDGDQPLTWLEGGRDAQLEVFADPKPRMVLTETGYYTLPGGPGWEGVDDPTQAKFLLNTYFDAVHLGVQRSYVYQLLDAYVDAGSSDQEKHFGVFDIDNQPKDAADALHNLTTILADGAADAASFPAGRLDHSVSGLPATGKSLLFQKADCSFAIAVWAEPDIWDENANLALSAQTANVVVTLTTSRASIDIYDPLQGTSPIQTLSDSNRVELALSDHPLLVIVN